MQITKVNLVAGTAVLASVFGSAWVSQDRYPGFEARYDEFGWERPFPIRRDDLAKSGKDVTSSLFAVRKEILAILERAQRPNPLREGRVRLLIRMGDDEWLVDEPGVVRHNGKDAALSDSDYQRLRLLLLGVLPVNDPSSIQQPFKREFAGSPPSASK